MKTILAVLLATLTGCSVGFQAQPVYPGQDKVTEAEAKVLEDHAKAIAGLQTGVKEIVEFINKATQATQPKPPEAPKK